MVRRNLLINEEQPGNPSPAEKHGGLRMTCPGGAYIVFCVCATNVGETVVGRIHKERCMRHPDCLLPTAYCLPHSHLHGAHARPRSASV